MKLVHKSLGLLSKLEFQVGIAILMGLLVVIGLGIYADFNELKGALLQFDWWLVPIILGLTILNYVLRAWRWKHFLGVLDIKVDESTAWWVFLSGLAMTVTPGRVGELVKSYFLKRLAKVEMSKTAPLVIFERLSDGLAMIVLMSGGLILTQYGLPAIGFSLAMAVLFVWVLHQKELVNSILKLSLKVPIINRYFGKFNHLYSSSKKLVSWRSLFIGWLLSLGAWAAEAYGFYLVLLGVGAEESWQLILLAFFIFGFAAIAGFLTFLPGGIGVAEGTMTGLVLLLVGLSEANSAAAALLGRLFTLWFGVAWGLVAMIHLHRKIARLKE